MSITHCLTVSNYRVVSPLIFCFSPNFSSQTASAAVRGNQSSRGDWAMQWNFHNTQAIYHSHQLHTNTGSVYRLYRRLSALSSSFSVLMSHFWFNSEQLNNYLNYQLSGLEASKNNYFERSEEIILCKMIENR